MSRLPNKYLTSAALYGAEAEGLAVTIFKPRGRTFWHVFFRTPDGRQKNLSTGTTDYDAAKVKAAELVANALRAPTEAAKELGLREELALLRHALAEQAALIRLMGGGKAVTAKNLSEAAREFLAEKEVSEGHYRDLERVCRLLPAWATAHGVVSVGDLTTAHIEAWLKDGRWDGKTFNARLNTAAILLNWCVKKEFCRECVADRVTRKKTPKRGRPKTLTLEQCVALMAYVEKHYPQYAAFYALALFAGVRSSTGKGGSELRRMLEDVQKYGWLALDGGPEYIWVERPKTESGSSGGARRAWVAPNCRAWIERYPAAKVPGVKATAEIISAIKLPKNGLRHTAVTAYVTHTQQIATASVLFGHDETTMRKHYLDAWSRAQAKAFYEIMPTPATASAVA